MKIKIILPACCLLIFFAATAAAKNIVVIGKDAALETNQQADNVIAVGGQATVGGLVENNVVAVGGSVVLTSGAVVRGNVICIGGVVVRGASSQVFGDITEINSNNFFSAFNSAVHSDWDGWSWIFAVISICFFFLLFIFALLITLLIPRPLIAVSTVIRRGKARSFIWGVLGLMLAGPLALLLAISLVGIPLIPLEIILVMLGIAVGFIAVGTLLGTFILIRICKRKESGMMKATLLGLTLLWLLGWIPYLGWIVKAIAATAGFGGVILSIFDRRPQNISPDLPAREI